MIPIVHVCRRRIRQFAEKAGGHSQIAYLAIATLCEGSMWLRLTSGSCLIFCVLMKVVHEEEGDAPKGVRQ